MVVDLALPRGVVLVLGNGTRVPVDLKHIANHPSYGRIFKVLIEADMVKLMPMIHAVDADRWPPGCTLQFPRLDGTLSDEWLQRVLNNSRILRRGRTSGIEYTK